MTRLRLALVAVVVSTLVSACFDGDDKIESNWTIPEARQFNDFPLYWVGMDYEGLPLTAVTHYEGGVLETVAFVYGDSSCNDSGCRAPIYIQIHPYCDSSPESVRSFLGALESAGYKTSVTEVRGVSGYLTDVPRIYLWTGSSAIEIDGDVGGPSVQKAARELIPLSEDLLGGKDPLPPPTTTEC